MFLDWKKTNILVCVISWHHESPNYLIMYLQKMFLDWKEKTNASTISKDWRTAIYYFFFFVLGFKSLLNIPERFRTLLQISAGTVLLLQHASSGLRLLILIHIVYNQYICRSFFFIFFCFLQLVIYQLFGKLRIQGFLNLWSFFLLCFSTS